MPAFLSLSILASALATVYGDYRGPGWVVYVFKPLTTALILALAFSAAAPVSAWYQAAVVLGLLFSLGGDVFLMLPSDRFVAGLVSFLVAHLFYIGAFASVAGAPASLPAFGLAVLYGAVLLRVLWPHVAALRMPVAAYALVLLVMAWLAAEQWLAVTGTHSLLALLGALLFVISDSVLALNRFVRPFAAAQAVVLGTYFTAQWLLALSVSSTAF